MRTSVDIDDQLLLYAKRRAVEQGCTLKQILEDALRDFFSHQSLPHEPVSLETLLVLATFSFRRRKHAISRHGRNDR